MMTVKIGIVGTGNFSQKHAEILTAMEGVMVVAVCGTSQQKAERFAEQFDGAKGYENFETMLDKQALDGVYLCVPPMAHGEMELELIKRRIPFFVEKPLGVTIEKPEEILAALTRQPLVTAVGYHFRYRESIQYLKDILKDHTVGMVTGQWMGAMPGVSWWRNQALSGGQFNEQTTHIVDLMRYLIGEVVEVQAYVGNRVMANQVDDVTVADVGTLNIQFASGVVANVTNTCILPEGLDAVGFTMYTDQAIIRWTPDELIIETAKEKQIIPDTLDAYWLEDEAFIAAIISGEDQQVLSTYSDAFQTQRITDAVQSSVEKKAPIKLKS